LWFSAKEGKKDKSNFVSMFRLLPIFARSSALRARRLPTNAAAMRVSSRFQSTVPPPPDEAAQPQQPRLSSHLRSEISRTLLMTLAFTFLGVGGVVAVFWTDIASWLGRSGADITTKTLADVAVKREAEELSKQVLHQIMQDPATVVQLRALLLKLSEDPATRVVIDELVASSTVRLLNDPRTLQHAGNLVATVIRTDQAVLNAASGLAADIVRSDVVRGSAIHLVDQLLLQQALRARLGEALQDAVFYSLTPAAVQRVVRGMIGTANAHSASVRLLEEQRQQQWTEGNDVVVQEAPPTASNATPDEEASLRMKPRWQQRRA
jgi:hypothetical protein